MKRGLFILLLGLLAGVLGFAGFYYVRMALHRELLHSSEPELAWLKHEFKLTDTELARITQLHEAYLPKCQERCAIIARQNEQLESLLATNAVVTPEIQSLLEARAKTRSECEAAMLKHFLQVSQTMPDEQRRRYLDWVEQQSSLHTAGMEQMHSDKTGGHMHQGM